MFHLATLTFAAVHLSNFVFSKTPYWLLPLLVLPQWLTGLALGWMRVRRGIGAAIALHAVFNAGPIVLIWAVMRWVPGAATWRGMSPQAGPRARRPGCRVPICLTQGRGKLER